MYNKLFTKQWPKWVGGVLLGLLNIAFFLYLMPLGAVYPAMGTWGIWTYKLAGINIESPWGPLEPAQYDIKNLITFGLFLGALVGALLSREFRIIKSGAVECSKSFTGGMLMGIGSLIAGSCIVGGFYSSIMALSLSGFYMMIGLIAGGFLGGKLLLSKKQGSPASCVSNSSSLSRTPLIGVLVIFLITLIVAAYSVNGKGSLAGILIFGMAFGLVFQRASFGFSSAFRDLFITRNYEMMRGVIISLIIGVIGFSIIKASSLKPASTFVMPAGLNSIIGGTIFGFGMVLSDG